VLLETVDGIFSARFSKKIFKKVEQNKKNILKTF